MKSIKIDKEIHKEFKLFCVKNELTIKTIVETLIKDFMKKDNKNENL